MARTLFFALTTMFLLISCGNESSQTSEKKEVKNEVNAIAAPDTVTSTFSINIAPDTVENGEEIKHYKNGKIQMRGMRKDGKRTGLWKSWYSDGTPWSETTFENGIKNGPTITWYENGNKRYEGHYKNDLESGKWTFWDEKGNLAGTNDFGQK